MLSAGRSWTLVKRPTCHLTSGHQNDPSVESKLRTVSSEHMACDSPVYRMPQSRLTHISLPMPSKPLSSHHSKMMSFLYSLSRQPTHCKRLIGIMTCKTQNVLEAAQTAFPNLVNLVKASLKGLAPNAVRHMSTEMHQKDSAAATRQSTDVQRCGACICPYVSCCVICFPYNLELQTK